jgi:hypothetical protein
MWWLAIGAAVGAIAGGVSTWQKSEREKAALKQQKDSAWKQYQYGKEYSDQMFGLQKGEALENLGVQRKNLDTQVGLSTDDYNTALLAQAFGIQDARIQTGSAVGASLVNEAASGVRGSATGDKIRAYASQSLERNIEVQDKQNANYLNRMITGANMTADAIGREEASWMPGGYRVQQKAAQDAYNQNIALLGQSDFNWRIEQSQPGFLDYFTGAMGGASTGMSLAYNINRFQTTW